MKKILLTGASGFIGNYLFNQLIDDGYEVIGIANKNNNGIFIQCNLTDKTEVFSLVTSVNPDIIIHCAALSSVTQGQTLDYYQLNVVASENLFQAIENLSGPKRRVILLSTAGVYGNQEVECLTEDLNPKPVSHYGLSKYVCERMLLNFSDKHNISILRPFNVIGHGQSEGFIIPKLVKHFHEKASSIELGNIQTYRDYIDVETTCKVISSLINETKSYNEIINICSGQATSLTELLDTLTNITGHEIQVILSAKYIRKNEVWTLIGSTSKLNSMIDIAYDKNKLIVSLQNMLEKSNQL